MRRSPGPLESPKEPKEFWVPGGRALTAIYRKNGTLAIDFNSSSEDQFSNMWTRSHLLLSMCLDFRAGHLRVANTHHREDQFLTAAYCLNCIFSATQRIFPDPTLRGM